MTDILLGQIADLIIAIGLVISFSNGFRIGQELTRD